MTAVGAVVLDDVNSSSRLQLRNSSLYVGDLDRDVTEAELFDLFSQVGPVASIRVCRDAVTRRSLGYAYVNYNSALDPLAAERALETLNHTPMNGKMMRIMWSHRDPSFRKSGLGNVFIKNLEKSIDNKALHDTFSAFGSILSCKVACDVDGASKGYGFVHFESEESANLAIEKVNGMLLEGKEVYVGPFKPRSDRPGDRNTKFTNVYVKNIDSSVSEEQLKELFEQCGRVTSCVIMKDNEGESKGFGFVNYQQAEDVWQALEVLGGQDFHGKELYVGRAQKKSEREALLKNKAEQTASAPAGDGMGSRAQGGGVSKLYVKNLPEGVDDQQLRDLFGEYGGVSSAKVVCDEQGVSKGFGFVAFSGAEEASKALAGMNGRVVEGKALYVALAQRKEERRQQLERQYPHAPPPPQRGARHPPNPPPMQAPHPSGTNAPPPPPLMPAYGMSPRPMYPPGPGGPAVRHGAPPMYPPPPHGLPRGPPPGRGRGPRGMMAQVPYPAGLGPARGAANGQAARGGRAAPVAMSRARGGGGRGRGEAPKPRPPPQQRPPHWPGPGPTPPPMPPTGPPPPGMLPPPPASTPPPPTAAPTAALLVPELGPLTPSVLAAASPEAQKQMTGERLFPLVHAHQPELAGKITGMLLEMDNSELLLLLECPEALEAKMEEAMAVLQQHDAVMEHT